MYYLKGHPFGAIRQNWLLTCTFCELIDVYERYQKLPHKTKKQKGELSVIKSELLTKVFNYDKSGAGFKTHQGIISGFFRKKMDDLNIPHATIVTWRISIHI